MSIVLKKNFVQQEQLEVFKNQAFQAATEFWNQQPDRAYPERKKFSFYPGCIIPNAGNILDFFMPVVKEVSEKQGWFLNFDSAIGSGVNYLNPQEGEILNYHIDKPLYELDSKFQIKPEYRNRFCSKTAILCLSNTANGGHVTYRLDEEFTDSVCLEAGDLLVMDGLTSHRMEKVLSGQVEYLACFYCANIS